MPDCPIPLQQVPEWRRLGRFFAIAVALHGFALFYPSPPWPSPVQPPAPLDVRLVESAPPVPAITPPVAAPLAPPPSEPKKKKPVPTPRPVMAVAPQPASPPPSFTVQPPVVAAPAPAVSAPVPATAPAADPAPAVVHAARFDAAYLQNPQARYPAISRRLGEEGKVMLKVRVTADGRAASVELEKSSNFERLDSAARQAVAGWRFVPAKRGDQAIESTVIVPVLFRLES